MTPSKAAARMTTADPGQTPASEVAPVEAAAAVLLRHLGLDPDPERVIQVRAYFAAALAGDWLERVLGLHADFTYVNPAEVDAHFVCDCGHPFGFQDGAHAEWEAHLAAAIRTAVGVTR